MWNAAIKFAHDLKHLACIIQRDLGHSRVLFPRLEQHKSYYESLIEGGKGQQLPTHMVICLKAINLVYCC